MSDETFTHAGCGGTLHVELVLRTVLGRDFNEYGESLWNKPIPSTAHTMDEWGVCDRCGMAGVMVEPVQP